MITDESEPSIFCELENNLSSSSSELTTDEDINTKLERKTSISLYNVSSTPHVYKELKKCKFRTGSQYNIDSDCEYKPKRKKYDHIESKVKKYRDEIREQTKKRRFLRQQQEDEIRKELENNLRMSTYNYDAKNHLTKFLPNEDLNENFSNISPIVNSNDAVDKLYHEPIEIKEKYNQALNEIENLHLEIIKLKAAKSITPRLNRRRKSLQSSMIKTCLFKNSSTAIRQNTLQNNTTLFGGDSTCRTIDIEDSMTPASNKEKHISSFRIIENDPFVIKSISQSTNSLANSSVPLLFDYETRSHRNRVYRFFSTFIKCPTMSFLGKIKSNKRNKVVPVPNVIISSPNNGNQDKNMGYSFEFVRTKISNDENLLRTPEQQLLKEMTNCCEELTEKMNRFKKLVNDYLNDN